MLLLTEPKNGLTKTMIADLLSASFSSTSKIVDELVNMNILIPGKQEGRNQFYKINLDAEIQDKNQITFSKMLARL